MKFIVPNSPDRRLDYVITGTGRCGTVYMAKLLTSIGFPCTHEAVFTFAGYRPYSKINSNVSVLDGRWLNDRDRIVADSSFMSAPYLKVLKKQDTKIIHVVRDPLRVIFSFIEGFDFFKYNHPDHQPFQEFMHKYVPELAEDNDPMTRACLYYVRWSEMIHKQEVDLFYPVESEAEVLIDFMGSNATSYYGNRRSNSRATENNHTYDEIPESEIKEQFVQLAKDYGYTIIKS